TFKTDDLLDGLGLAYRLQRGGRSDKPTPAKRVWSLLSDEARTALNRTIEQRHFDDTEARVLVSSLNEMIERTDFYSPEAFADVFISEGIRNQLELGLDDLTVKQRQLVNRQIFDAAFVEEVAPAGKDRTVKGYLWVRGSSNTLTGQDLAQVGPTTDQSGRPAIAFSFKPGAAATFQKLTGENIGKRLAMVLNDEIRNAPNINDAIGGSGIITGNFSYAEVRQAVQYIQQGSLPVKPKLVRKTSVGATLGQDLVRRSITAAMWCGICIVAFMLIYYLWSGAISVVGLGLNMLIILAVMALFGQTLWLAGIVGLLLTVGMSVDANVLIFERIREEQEAGRGLAMCVQKGYGRAAGAIFDSNLTTIFTAIALYMTGMPQLKSFSFTLGVGILGSMFCALFVTRVLFDLMVEKRLATRVPMLKLIRETAVPFMRQARWAIIFSGIGIVVGLYAFFFRDIANPLHFAWLVLGVPTMDLAGAMAVVVRLVLAALLVLLGLWVLKTSHRKLAEHEQATGEAGGGPVEPYGTSPAGKAGLVVVSYVIAALVVFFSYGAMVVPDQGTPAEGEAARSDIAVYMKQVGDGIRKNLDIDFRSGARVDLMLSRQGSLNPSDVEKNLATALNNRDIRVAGIELVGPDGKIKTAEFVVDCAGVPPSEVMATIRESYAERIEPNDVVDITRQGGTPRVRFGLKRTRLARDEVSALLAEKAGLEQFDVQTRSGAEAVAMSSSSGLFSIRFQARSDRVRTEQLRRISEAMSEHIDRQVVPVRFEDVTVQELDNRLQVTARVLPVAGMSRALAREEIDYGLDRLDTQLRASGLTGAETVLVESRLPDVDSFTEFTFTLEQPSEAFMTKVRAAEADRSLEEALADWFDKTGADTFTVVRAFGNESYLSPSESMKMVRDAILAIFLSLFFIVAYVWFRFGSLRYGLAAITALVHDVLLTLGAVAVADLISGGQGRLLEGINRALMIGDVKIGLGTVAAFLTLIGYSLNDTIVVFGRIRENLHGNRRLVPDVINRSINQMLGRTILTSVTTLIVVVVQYIFGGASIHSLCFVLIVGVIVGTYSSIFIASPILI
ncbi:MAG: protein translocase subunit SecD, partial [Planctomycetota bacterium]